MIAVVYHEASKVIRHIIVADVGDPTQMARPAPGEKVLTLPSAGVNIHETVAAAIGPPQPLLDPLTLVVLPASGVLGGTKFNP